MIDKEKLNSAHLKMLQESAISDEVIKERGYRTVKREELTGLGFALRQQRDGLLIQIWTTDGQEGGYILRPDNPRVVEDKKKKNADGTYPNKIIKYEFPKGQSMRLDSPPKCQPMLADPTIPLWITEGVKKADSLASRGLCAIALLGVWNFKGKNHFGGTTFLADFDYIAFDDRDVRIVFDSDVMTKLQVREALKRLTEHLQRRKANVAPVYLPNDKDGCKMGVDDYLTAGHTVKELEALIESPRPELIPAKPIVELLDEPPQTMRRPLSLIGGHAYLATWLWTKITIRESVDNEGKIIRHRSPRVKKELRLLTIDM